MDELALATLDELHDAHHGMRAEGERLAGQADALNVRAEDRFAEAGAHAVPRREWWGPPAEVVPLLDRADRLVARISTLDRRLDGDSAGTGWHRRIRARVDSARRDRAAAQLRAVLVTIATSGVTGMAHVPDVGPILLEATELQARARGLHLELAARAPRLAELEREIARRQQAQRLLGFDSVHLAACFSRYGLPEVASPYQLEPGEVAHLTMSAWLVRPHPPQPSERDGTGVAPPPDLTGLMDWMGVFRDRPAPAGAAGPDPGELLLTSRRLAFVGTGESTAVWLDSVVDMDVYRDGISVLHLGSSQRLVLRVQAPREVAFSINWAVQRWPQAVRSEQHGVAK